MIFLLEANPVTFIEKLSYGGKMLLIGMGTVFASLAILWGCLELMRIFFYDIPRKKAQRAVKEPEEAQMPEAVYTAQAETTGAEADDEEEIIAAIAAAVAAAEEQQPQFRFRAVSFKRIK